eukprot:1309654-Pleurochrysis_carterae.AAC.1
MQSLRFSCKSEVRPAMRPLRPTTSSSCCCACRMRMCLVSALSESGVLAWCARWMLPTTDPGLLASTLGPEGWRVACLMPA